MMVNDCITMLHMANKPQLTSWVYLQWVCKLNGIKRYHRMINWKRY